MDPNIDLSKNGYLFFSLTPYMQTKELALIAVTDAPEIFSMLESRLRSDYDIAYQAVTGNGSMYAFLTEEQKENQKFLIPAIRTFPFALHHAYYIDEGSEMIGCVIAVQESLVSDNIVNNLIKRIKASYPSLFEHHLCGGKTTKSTK